MIERYFTMSNLICAEVAPVRHDQTCLHGAHRFEQLTIVNKLSPTPLWLKQLWNMMNQQDCIWLMMNQLSWRINYTIMMNNNTQHNCKRWNSICGLCTMQAPSASMVYYNQIHPSTLLQNIHQNSPVHQPLRQLQALLHRDLIVRQGDFVERLWAIPQIRFQGGQTWPKLSKVVLPQLMVKWLVLISSHP